jgi:hypothetical protein
MGDRLVDLTRKSTDEHGRSRIGERQPKTRRRARKMCAAARKAVSARMKKYWAARRKAKAAAEK